MNVFPRVAFPKILKRGALGLTVAAGLSLAAGAALADDPTTMAPPIDGAGAPLDTGGNAGVNASADSVFNWQEIPANQQVPLSRAAFDRGGYQLYDTVGETIVVPFTNQNLYVMKFAESPNGKLYFVNEGGYPVLYVPKGGYLENAAVAGARWYPLGENFHPVEPVFLGIAPSYDEFVDLGWYPNTFFYGGYYGHTSFVEGGVFLPTIGLFFSIGGHPYYGWNGYHRYYENHPGFFQTVIVNRNYYHYGGDNNYRYFNAGRRFAGAGNGYYGGDHFGSARQFGGGSRYYAHRTFSGGSGYAVHSGGGQGQFGGGSHTFRGAGGGQSYGGQSYGGQSYGGQSYGGQSYGGQSYGGTHSYSGGQSGSRAYSTHTFQGGSSSFGQSGRSYGGGQSYRSSSSSGQSPHSFSGGGRSSGGGDRSGGGRSGGSQAGGGRSSSGGGGHR